MGRRGWRGSGGPAVRAYRRALDRLRAAESADPSVRAGILQAMALTEEPAALPALDLAVAAGWTPMWSRGDRSGFHTRLAGHAGPVLSVAFGEAAGRAVLATGGADHTVRLWDPRARAVTTTMTGHTGAVVELAFATPGRRPVLASASDDRTVRLWDPGTGRPRGTVALPEGDVAGVAILTASGGDRLVVATDIGSGYRWRGAIDVWDVDSGDHLGRIRDRDWSDLRASGGLAVVPGDGGDLLAAFAEDGDAVLLLDPVTGSETAVLEWTYDGHDHEMFTATLVPPLVVCRHDGRLLLGVTAEAELDHQGPNTTAAVVWWDVHTGEVVNSRQLDLNESVLAATTVDGSGRFVTATSLPRRIGSGGDRVDLDVFVQPVAGPRTGALRGHAGHVHAAAFGAIHGAAVAATAGADGTVLLWDTDTAPPGDRHLVGAAGGLAIVADPARPVLVAGTGRSSVDLLDPITGSQIGRLRCQVYPGEPGHQCPDLTREAGWLVSNDHCRRGVAAGVVDGRWLIATHGNGRGVPLWDPQTRDVVRVLDHFPHGPIRFGPAGERSVLVTDGWMPHVWDPATGVLLATLGDEGFDTGNPGSMAFGSSRGHPVVSLTGITPSGAAAIGIWDPLTGEHLRRVPVDGDTWYDGPPDTSPGTRLAAGADVLAHAVGDQVRLWDPGTGAPLSTATGADGMITCLDLTTTDGRILLAGGTEHGTVHLWTGARDAIAARLVATLATFARPVHTVRIAQIGGQIFVFAQATTGRLTASRIDAPLW
jgi:WD40 repeat protein